MPTLVCALHDDAGLAALMPGLCRLREAGEALAIWAPAATMAAPGAIGVESGAALEQAWEDELLPMVAGPQSLAPPSWLPAAECDRVLVIAAAEVAGGNLSHAQWSKSAGAGSPLAGVVAALLAAGCEAVELLAPAEVAELHQSWTSGRRVGLRIFQ